MSDDAAPATTTDLSEQIEQEEQQLTAADPALVAELDQQAEQAEQEAQADPAQAQEVAAQFLATEIQEISAVDPQLAQNLQLQEAEQQGQPATTTGTPTTPVEVGEQEQQLLQEDPSLAMEIQQQEQQAQVEEQQDPSDALQISEQLNEQEIQDIDAVDPQLAEALAQESDVPGTPAEVTQEELQTENEWTIEQQQFQNFDNTISGTTTP